MRGFPLLVGIVGQDTIAESELPSVKASARSIVDDLHRDYPHTEIVVFCAANGRAAEAALDGALAAGARLVSPGRDAVTNEWIAAAHVLLLVWDRHTSALACAQAAQIREGRFRGPDWRPLENPDVGPYYVLDPSGTLAKEYPARYNDDAEGERDFHGALRALDRYNHEMSAATTCRDETLEEIRAQTDAIANRLQRSTVGWQTTLYALALLAAVIQVVVPGWPWWIKVVVILLTLVVYRIVRRHDVQNRYQDYRAVAEALRVQNAWWCATVGDAVHRAYLRMQQSELQWIRMVLRVAALLDRPAEIHLHPESLRRWIDRQQDYFLRAGNRAARREAVCHSAIGILVSANIVISLAAGISLSIWRGNLNAGASIQFALGAFAACGAVLVGLLSSYAHARSFGENAKRYRRMFLLFGEARSELEALLQTNEVEPIRHLVRALGREALTEQAEWLLSQRDRPVSIVHGAG
ncbi:MAG TPA: hypothetical protein VGZ02_11435 [Candidatus Baltobacteraceae bacterium]|nr:hypothetical protein [Candidatus Baltobacteraceae bacterium]